MTSPVKVKVDAINNRIHIKTAKLTATLLKGIAPKVAVKTKEAEKTVEQQEEYKPYESKLNGKKKTYTADEIEAALA